MSRERPKSYLSCSGGSRSTIASDDVVGGALLTFACRDAVQPPVAKYLDVILYSREQIMKENAGLPC